MTKKVIKALLLLAVLTSCEEIENSQYKPYLTDVIEKVAYNNGQGYNYVASFQDIEMNVVNAEPSDYSLQIRQTIRIDKEGTELTNVGFKINSLTGENMTLPATIVHNGNEVVAEATLRCNYDNDYSVTPFYCIDQFELCGTESFFHRSIEDMKPHTANMSTDVEMVLNAHTITPVVEVTELVDEVEFTFAGTTRKGIKNGSRFTADFDLIDLKAADGDGIEYSGIKYVAINKFGQASGSISYSVRIKNSDDMITNFIGKDDGVKPNYITIGGANWARGNLIYKNGKWSIDDDPLSHPVTQQNKSFVQYFSFGSTAADPDKYHDFASVDNVPIEFSGDIRYDVAAANLAGWRIPNQNEALYLSILTSKQNCKTGIVAYPIKDVKKEFYSCTQVTLKAVPSDGLYFPNGGLYGRSTNTGTNLLYPNLGAYMTDYKFDLTDLWGGIERCCYCMYFYNPNHNNKGMGCWYLFDSKYKGYGSYDMENKVHFSSLWKYFVRPVHE